MPNWCSNYASISGDAEAINKIIDTFNNVWGDTPMFQKWIGEKLDWGTKWDVWKSSIDMVYDEGDNVTEVSLLFDTAWSPPTNFYEALANKYGVSIYAEYEEMGNDFAGTFEVDVYGESKDNCYSYWEGIYRRGDNQYFWEELYHHFNDRIEEEAVTIGYIDEEFPFINGKDRQELIDTYVKQD